MIAEPPPLSALQTVVLVGNPNSGKTTLFNRLTGARQRVGNYSGVTVTRQSGEMRIGEKSVTVIDLPGTYSLAASSPDERVAADVLTGRRGPPPDLVICLANALQLRRSLFLVCQIRDFGVPVMVAVNFIDEAEARGLRIDTERLERELGAPVVLVAARSGRGMEKLREAVANFSQRKTPGLQPVWPEAVGKATWRLRGELAGTAGRELFDAELRRVLFDEESAELDLAGYPVKDRRGLLARVRQPLMNAGLDFLTIEAETHYAFIDGVLARVLKQPPEISRGFCRADRLLTHRVAGPLIFGLLMFGMFHGIYALSEPMVAAIEAATDWLAERGGAWLEPVPVFRSLVCDGILAGVGGVVVFLPQIALLFLFLALLEGTGYMARAAVLADRLFGWCGLSGKSFVPLLSGSACAVPGILASRTIEEPRARLITILITPLMSCSARLPVYLLLLGAFVQPRWGSTVAALALMGIQTFGLVMALTTAWVATRILRAPPQAFVMELPPYRLPTLRDVGWRIFGGAGDFLQRAGTIILAISVLIWALLYFPHRENATPAEQVEQSWLGQAGHTLEPVLALAGFDWKITVGVLASFPAREVVVSTLGIIYNAGDEDGDGLGTVLSQARWGPGPREGRPVFTLPVVLALMVFFALCLQCSSTVVVMGREAGWRLAVGAFLYMTALAWIGAVVVYQVGSRL
jgi:ferrous iron transport protein B